MSIGYDPFKWADIYNSEELYFEDLRKDDENARTNDNDRECDRV